MKITITNFRCIESKIYKFKPGTTLIDGASGSGKSTIFQAISWCLYCIPRNRILPKIESKERTCVKLEFDDFTIVRKKRPEYLEFITKDNKYIDDVAQAIIIEKFGNYNVWKSCSYLSQGDRNLLFELGNDARKYLISNLAIGKDADMESYFEKLSTKILANKKELESSTSIVNFEENNFKTKHKNITTDYSLTSLDTELLNLNIQRDLLVKLVEDNNKLEIKSENLTKTINDLDHQLSQINLISDAELETLKSRLDYLNRFDDSHLAKIARYNHLASLNLKFIELMEEVKLPEVNFLTEKELLKENIINQKYSVKDYDNALDLENKINQAKSDLSSDSENKLKFFKFIINNRTIITNLLNYKDLDVSHYSNYKQRLTEINLLLMSANHKCPSCSVDLEFKNGQLSLAKQSFNPETLKIEKFELEKKIKEIETRNQYLETIKFYHYDLDFLISQQAVISDPDLTKKVDELTNLLHYSRLNLPSPSSAEIKAILELSNQLENDNYEIRKSNLKIQKSNQEIKSHNTNLKLAFESAVSKNKQIKDHNNFANTNNQLFQEFSELAKIVNLDLLEIREEKNKLTNQLAKHNQQAEKQQLLKSFISQNRIELASIKLDPDAKTRLAQLDEKIKTFSPIRMYLVDLEKLNSLKFNNKRLTDDYANLLKLQQISYYTEICMYENMINTLNNHIRDIISNLFDNPIEAKIELIKNNKTSDRRSINIHLKVSYQGMEIENISELSGGEADRLSLALTLALAKTQNSQLLILDEVLSSLNFELRERCLSIINSLNQDDNVITLIVLHEATSAYFDKEISME